MRLAINGWPVLVFLSINLDLACRAFLADSFSCSRLSLLARFSSSASCLVSNSCCAFQNGLRLLLAAISSNDRVSGLLWPLPLPPPRAAA
jgi:flagellar biosynthesis protein FliR